MSQRVEATGAISRMVQKLDPVHFEYRNCAVIQNRWFNVDVKFWEDGIGGNIDVTNDTTDGFRRCEGISKGIE